MRWWLAYVGTNRPGSSPGLRLKVEARMLTDSQQRRTAPVRAPQKHKSPSQWTGFWGRVVAWDGIEPPTQGFSIMIF